MISKIRNLLAIMPNSEKFVGIAHDNQRNDILK